MKFRRHKLTQLHQKASERLLVEMTISILGKKWHLEESEKPDFIVTDDQEKFGLEVCEIFAGKHGKKGSKLKEEENTRQQKICAMRKKFEEKENAPLWLEFYGDITDEKLDQALILLLKEILTAEEFGRKIHIEIGRGGNALKIRGHIRSEEPSRWNYVSDQTGWVDSNSTENRIHNAINKKSGKLAEYRKRTSLNDIRLLIFANRIKNSGKLALREGVELKLNGFKAVYFCSYPEKVSVFRECTLSNVCRRDYLAG